MLLNCACVCKNERDSKAETTLSMYQQSVVSVCVAVLVVMC